MELQTVLSVHQGPPVQLSSGNNSVDFDGVLSGDNRFLEYLRQAEQYTARNSADPASRDTSSEQESRAAGSADYGSDNSSGKKTEAKESAENRAVENSTENPTEKAEKKSGERKDAAGAEAGNKAGDEKSEDREKITAAKNEKDKGTVRNGRKEASAETEGKKGLGISEAASEESLRKQAVQQAESEQPRAQSGEPAAEATAVSAAAAEADGELKFQATRNGNLRNSEFALGKIPENEGDKEKKSKITIIDERSASERSEKKTDRRRRNGADRAALRSNTERTAFGKPDTAEAGGERTSETAVRYFRLETEPAAGKEDSAPAARNTHSADQNSLFRNLKSSGNKEIVHRSGIILKDNSSGEIRMELKPEKLGKVRIQIHLKDNTLSGKIIVESSAVREVFESNMEALNRAFKESGFDTAHLDVQVGGGKQQEGHHDSRKNRPRTAWGIRSLEEHVPLARDSEYSDSVIDLIV